jgi:hypothetical protein
MTCRKAQGELKLTNEQILLGIHIRELGMLPEYERKVCDDRDYRFDVVILGTSIAIEIHGGQHSGGHRRGVWSKKEYRRRKDAGQIETPQEEEYCKLNRAQMDGWKVLQFTNEQVNDGRAKDYLATLVGQKRSG